MRLHANAWEVVSRIPRQHHCFWFHERWLVDPCIKIMDAGTFGGANRCGPPWMRVAFIAPTLVRWKSPGLGRNLCDIKAACVSCLHPKISALVRYWQPLVEHTSCDLCGPHLCNSGQSTPRFRRLLHSICPLQTCVGRTSNHELLKTRTVVKVALGYNQRNWLCCWLLHACNRYAIHAELKSAAIAVRSKNYRTFIIHAKNELILLLTRQLSRAIPVQHKLVIL